MGELPEETPIICCPIPAMGRKQALARLSSKSNALPERRKATSLSVEGILLGVFKTNQKENHQLWGSYFDHIHNSRQSDKERVGSQVVRAALNTQRATGRQRLECRRRTGSSQARPESRAPTRIFQHLLIKELRGFNNCAKKQKKMASPLHLPNDQSTRCSPILTRPDGVGCGIGLRGRGWEQQSLQVPRNPLERLTVSCLTFGVHPSKGLSSRAGEGS